MSEIPGDDEFIGFGQDGEAISIVNAIKEFRRESHEARKTRLKIDRETRMAYMGQQDWSHKQKGQSKEFIPKVPIATEQVTAFVKRGLTQFGKWYEITVGRDSPWPLSGTQTRNLLDVFLENVLVADNKVSKFTTLISDAVKVGTLESLMVVKVHGNVRTVDRAVFLENGDAAVVEDEEWQLRIDLIRPEDYFPDPTGDGLYEIHRSEKDISHLHDRAAEGVYDQAVVDLITESMTRTHEEQRRPQEVGQDYAPKPSFRKTVVIDEFWGTILDADGRVLHRNVFCTVVNDKWLVRKPEPNPFWHQKSPFVAVPLIRVPFSVWHKSLMQHAAQLNFAINELFNLVLDGAISSVWGIKQLRSDDLADPDQVSDGIQQGMTLDVKNTLPHGQKVLETVSEGKVPGEAMAVLDALSREFASSALTNELKMGNLPGRRVLATEVVEITQGQAVTMDSLVGDIENEFIEKILELSILTILQNLDNVFSDKIVSAIGERGVMKLASMDQTTRVRAFSSCHFKVSGLSEVLTRVRDFQKLMGLLQAVVSNPLLLTAFFKKYSPDRVLSHMMKSLSINPEQMERDEDEINALADDLGLLQQIGPMAGNGGGAALSGPGADGSQIGGDVNQVTNGPLSGATGNQ